MNQYHWTERVKDRNSVHESQSQYLSLILYIYLSRNESTDQLCFRWSTFDPFSAVSAWFRDSEKFSELAVINPERVYQILVIQTRLFKSIFLHVWKILGICCHLLYILVHHICTLCITWFWHIFWFWV